MTITYRTVQEALEPEGNPVLVTYINIGTDEFGRLLGPTACGSILFQAAGHYQEVASFQFASIAQAKAAIQGAVTLGEQDVIARRMRKIAGGN